MRGDHVDQKDRAIEPQFLDNGATALPAPRAPLTPIAPAPVADIAVPGRQRAAWLRAITRVIRNAAIAVGLLTLVPVGLVAVRGDTMMRALTWSQSARQRTVIANRLRFMALPKDPSITPLVAGRALVSLTETTENGSDGFRELDSPRRIAAPWDSLKVAAGMFPGAEAVAYSTPNPHVLQQAAKRALSPAERAYLQSIALSPIWGIVGTVARAPAIDILGARFRLPLGPDARWEQMPLMRSRQLREIGNAASSRAAWFLDRGQRDSAEATLRTVISFGFAVIDNATTMMDQIGGTVVVALGREGMRELYTAVGDPRAGSRAVAPIRKNEFPPEPHRGADELKRYLLARLNDPSAPRGERIEIMRALSFSSCTNVRELLLGPSEKVQNALDMARHSLSRFPSEEAVLNLAGRLPEVSAQQLGYAGPMDRLAVSASAAAGAVLRNPRLATCALFQANIMSGR